MAQRQVTVFTDDVTGEELEDGETVSFALDGVEYEIDLSGEHAEQLRDAVAPYIRHGRRISGRSARSSRSGGSASRRSADSDSSSRASGGRDHDTRAIREWAQANGHNAPAR